MKSTDMSSAMNALRVVCEAAIPFDTRRAALSVTSSSFTVYDSDRIDDDGPDVLGKIELDTYYGDVPKGVIPGNVRQVSSVFARHGYGPSLYDLVMSSGIVLTQGQTQSSEAKALWQVYMTRGDVKKFWMDGVVFIATAKSGLVSKLRANYDRLKAEHEDSYMWSL